MAFQGIVLVEADEFFAEAKNISAAVDGLTFRMHSDA